MTCYRYIGAPLEYRDGGRVECQPWTVEEGWDSRLKADLLAFPRAAVVLFRKEELLLFIVLLALMLSPPEADWSTWPLGWDPGLLTSSIGYHLLRLIPLPLSQMLSFLRQMESAVLVISNYTDYSAL